MGQLDELSSMGLNFHYSVITFSVIRESLRPVARVLAGVSLAAGFARILCFFIALQLVDVTTYPPHTCTRTL